MSEQKKKRPAHEVILDDLKQLDEEYLIEIDRSRVGQSPNVDEIILRMKTLVSVLKRMHIPLSEHQKVIEKLRELPWRILEPMSEDYLEITSEFIVD